MASVQICTLNAKPGCVGACSIFSARPRRIQSAAARQHSCRRRGAQVTAALTSEALLAVTQQSILFVVAAAAETAFTLTEVKAGTPGRPSVLAVAGLSAVTLAGVALVQQDSSSMIGLVVGTAATAGLCALSLKRVFDTPYEPLDWPGKKAWPALTVLLSFFATSIFLQGLAGSLE